MTMEAATVSQTEIIYDPELHGTLLTPDAAIAHLKEKHAVEVGPQRIADLRSIGGGSRFIKPTLRDLRYPVNLLDEWAAARNRKPIVGCVPVKSSARREAATDEPASDLTRVSS